MDSQDFVQLALEVLSCSQKELATKLAVSPTQISKWKKGDHMSLDMEEKFREITGIAEKSPSFVLQAGSVENAAKWEKLIDYLADIAYENAETVYNTTPLKEERELLCWHTFNLFNKIGVTIPETFPQELDINYDGDEDEWDAIWGGIDNNPYSNLIYKTFNSLNDVYGFYAAYIYELMYDDDLGLYSTPAEEIESCLLSLAACKIDVDVGFAPQINKFKHETYSNYEEWLNIVKDKAFRAGVPLKAELLELVHRSADELGHEAEAESLGFNAGRIHPDIYMNELLVGMRIIHQVLPVIMEKLGIDDFKLDDSTLRI